MNKSSKEYKAGYEAGVALAGAYHNGSGNKVMAKVAALMASKEVQDSLCKAAKYILEVGGEKDSTAYRLYDTIERFDGPLTKYSCDRFLNPVIATINEASRELNGEPSIEKVASSILPGAASVVGKTLGSGHSLINNLMLLGGLTGASLGGLAWYVNRAAKENDIEADAKEEQARHYRRIAKDLQRRLKLEARDKEEEAVERIASEEVPGAYVL